MIPFIFQMSHWLTVRLNLSRNHIFALLPPYFSHLQVSPENIPSPKYLHKNPYLRLCFQEPDLRWGVSKINITVEMKDSKEALKTAELTHVFASAPFGDPPKTIVVLFCFVFNFIRTRGKERKIITTLWKRESS